MSSLSSTSASATNTATTTPLSSNSSSSSSPPLLLPRLPVFQALLDHAYRPDASTSAAVVHSLSGRTFSYADLPANVCAVRDRLKHAAAAAAVTPSSTATAANPTADILHGERIAFLVENSYDYVVTFLAVLAAGAIAVPLSPAFPISELQYIVDHCEVRLLAASPKFLPKAQELLAKDLKSKPALVQLEKHLGRDKAAGKDRRNLSQDVLLDTPWSHESDARVGPGIMLYTSGTTSRPVWK
jgi:malonyl-CoA/methylmalonyl-CoA synthetase